MARVYAKLKRRYADSTPDAAPGMPATRVAELHAALDEIAPFRWAAEWDNVGLLAGAPDWPAARVLLTIDLTDAVAAEALAGDIEAVLAYHPPIFKPIQAVTPTAAAATTRLPELLARRIAILATHTALDAAPGGTNDVLLDAVAPVERFPLETQLETAAGYKLVVFAPADEIERLRAALAQAGAGRIGHYSECSFELAGRGSFRGDETTHPAVGRRGRLELIDESRLEMVVARDCLGAVVRALYRHHSYEEPAFDLYPVQPVAGRGAAGLGRVGRLAQPQSGAALLRRLRGCCDLAQAVRVGDLKRRFTSVTAAAGAFGARAFRDPDSLILTGELKHHEALELARRGLTAICLGHWASERPALERLRAELTKRLPGVQFRLARADGSPFRRL